MLHEHCNAAIMHCMIDLQMFTRSHRALHHCTYRQSKLHHLKAGYDAVMMHCMYVPAQIEVGALGTAAAKLMSQARQGPVPQGGHTHRQSVLQHCMSGVP